eukprot:m.473309 g.473309  ORF g.473309 m.473309 type:complete len:579 (-) comp57120_c0_seq8:53-1789(-)
MSSRFVSAPTVALPIRGPTSAPSVVSGSAGPGRCQPCLCKPTAAAARHASKDRRADSPARVLLFVFAFLVCCCVVVVLRLCLEFNLDCRSCISRGTLSERPCALLPCLCPTVLRMWGARVLLCASLLVATAAADSCLAIQPQTDPTLNYQARTSCLSSEGTAILSGGVYPVSQGIVVPTGGTFQGNPAVPTVVQLASDTSSNFLLMPGTASVVSFIAFDANGNLPSGCCSAVFSVGDVSGALVHDCAAYGQDDPIATGIYFIDERATNNTFLRVNVSAMQYGVIFVQGLLPGSANVVLDSFLFENHCDSVTFAGYGELVGTTIQNNGWDCKNGNPPIPGGGPYCLGNTVGARVIGNTVSNNCGMVFDIDSCGNFEVSGNHFSQPGNTWNGAYPYCQGSLAVNLIDSHDFTFENNFVANTISSNAVGLSHWGDSNGVFEDSGAAPFSDLPAGGNTVLAFSVVTRPSTQSTTSNSIVNNTFIADCSTSGCVGVGYFAGRGTGWVGAGGSWAPSMYTGNSPFGSQIGSVRCGGNWYAGNTAECGQGASYPCNQDDYQHSYPPWRNDPGCGTYSGAKREPTP